MDLIGDILIIGEDVFRMLHHLVDRRSLTDFRRALRRLFGHIQPSHLAEATACGFGSATHAALLIRIKNGTVPLRFSAKAFNLRLNTLCADSIPSGNIPWNDALGCMQIASLADVTFQKLLDDAQTREIMWIGGLDYCYSVRMGEGIKLLDDKLGKETDVKKMVNRLAVEAGQPIGLILDFVHPSGFSLAFVDKEISNCSLTVIKNWMPMTLRGLMTAKCLDNDMSNVLKGEVRWSNRIAVVGRHLSGVTTMVNALCLEAPHDMPVFCCRNSGDQETVPEGARLITPSRADVSLSDIIKTADRQGASNGLLTTEWSVHMNDAQEAGRAISLRAQEGNAMICGFQADSIEHWLSLMDSAMGHASMHSASSGWDIAVQLTSMSNGIRRVTRICRMETYPDGTRKPVDACVWHKEEGAWRWVNRGVRHPDTTSNLGTS